MCRVHLSGVTELTINAPSVSSEDGGTLQATVIFLISEEERALLSAMLCLTTSMV